MNPLFRLLLLSCLLATGCLPSLPCESGECELALFSSLSSGLTGASQQANVATILPAGGYYDSEITVSMSHPDPGATLYYTTDGTTPTTSSSVYATPFVLPDSGLAEIVTVKVLAVLSDGSTDPVQSTTYRRFGFLYAVGASGSNAGHFYLPQWSGIGSSNNIFISETYYQPRVNRYLPDGTFNVMWGQNVGGAGTHFCYGPLCSGGLGDCSVGQPHLDTPSGIAVGGGRVYVADRHLAAPCPRIMVYDEAGTFITDFGGPGAAEGLFPGDIADLGLSGNRLIVADKAAERIQIFDTASGTPILVLGRDVGGAGTDICNAGCSTGTTGTAEGQFTSPEGNGVATDGSFWVAEPTTFRIQHFDTSGSFLKMWGKGVDGATGFICTGGCSSGTTGTAEQEFISPRDVAVAADGSIYVADGNRIQKFAANGIFLRMWGRDVGGPGVPVCYSGCSAGTAGAGNGEFNGPQGISVDSNGRVIVVDTGNHRIQAFGYP